MNDMSEVIIPKSDQWNFDDFQTGPITFKVKAVKVKGGQDQPVDISLEGTDKFYRPCKSMARVLVHAWGADSKNYVGRSMTLYGDPKVKWGGMEVGGIRISHMSDIDSTLTMALTATRGNKKPYVVKPLVASAPVAAPTVAAEVISEAQKKRLEARIGEVGIDRDKVKKYVKKTFGLDHFAEMNKAQYDEIDRMLTDYKPKPAAKPATTEPTLSDRIKACATVEELDALADAFTEAEAVTYLKDYTKRKNELLDAAETAQGGGL